MMDINRTSEYNDEDVFYCSKCLSLRIKTLEGIDYCEECGSTAITEGSIFVWENLCMQKYGRPSWEKQTEEDI